MDDFGGFAEDSGDCNPLESGIITMLQTDEDEKVWDFFMFIFRTILLLVHSYNFIVFRFTYWNIPFLVDKVEIATFLSYLDTDEYFLFLHFYISTKIRFNTLLAP